MRYAVVKLTDEQFKQYMRITAPGGLLIVSIEAIEMLLEPEDLRAVRLPDQAMELDNGLVTERADRRARELRDGDRR